MYQNDDFVNLSEVAIQRIRIAAKTGDSSVDDICELMRYFCHLTDTNQPIPEELKKFISQSFTLYLNNKKSLERGFGLKGERGRKLDQERNVYIAADILHERMKGLTLEKATEKLIDKYNLEESQLRKIWAQNKLDAIIHIRLKNARHWSDAEKEKLNRIFDNKIDSSWYNPTL